MGQGFTNTEKSKVKTTKALPYLVVSGQKTYKFILDRLTTTTVEHTIGGDSICFFPCFLTEGQEITEFAVRVNSTGSSASGGTTTFQIAIYDSKLNIDDQIVPNSLLIKSSNMNMNTTGVKVSVFSTPYKLPQTAENVYWIAIRNNSALSFRLAGTETADMIPEWGAWQNSNNLSIIKSLEQTWQNSNIDFPLQLAQTGGFNASKTTTSAINITTIPVIGIA